MAEPNWGLLEKSQVDNETIEEAIDRLIKVHEDGANSHIGAGKSLNTHKTQATVDHPADSVIEDKIPDRAITVPKLNPDKFYFVVDWRTHDGLDEDNFLAEAAALGSYRLATQGGVAETRFLFVRAGAGSDMDFDKNSEFELDLKVVNTLAQTIIFGAGNVPPWGDDAYYGFKIVDDVLYATHYDFNTDIEVTTEIAGITLTNKNRYRAVYIPDTSVKFYVNDVLEATHLANLIDTNLSGQWFGAKVVSDNAVGQRLVTFYQLQVIMDE